MVYTSVMTKRFQADSLTGRYVTRKRDSAIGEVIEVSLSAPSTPHPGVWGKTIIVIRLQDQTLREAAGGDMTGDLGWFRSNFKVVK